MTTYPDGYGTATITYARMVAKHGPKQHPEFRRRFFAYIESQNGQMGVGGGWRATGSQPDKPGFAAEGKSFHQNQRFASGFIGYAAVDLVMNSSGNVHRSPTWAETSTAPAFGLHTFIKGEPWHIQPLEIRGHATWVNAGRPDPRWFTLPGDLLPVPPRPSNHQEIDMIALDYNPGTPGWVAMTYTGTHLAHVVNGHADAVIRAAKVARQTVARDQLAGIIQSAQTTTPPPPAGFDPALVALWREAG